MFEVIQVLISETMVWWELYQIGMEWLQFVNNIDSVIDPISCKFVNKERVIGIYFDEKCQNQEVTNKKSYFQSHKVIN